MTTKLAIPTDDGETIRGHFGQAKYFRVITLEDDRAARSKLREKASHQHGDQSRPEGIHHRAVIYRHCCTGILVGNTK